MEKKTCFNIYLIIHRLLCIKLSWNKIKRKHRSNIGIIGYFNAKVQIKKLKKQKQTIINVLTLRLGYQRKCAICTFFVGILGDIEQSAFPYYTFPFEYLIISRYGFICVCFVLSRKYESYHSTYQRKYRGIR